MTGTEREQWLRWRREGIGSSDIAAIVGLSPWATPYSTWAEKTGRVPLDDGPDSVVQEFGRRAEAMIGPWFAERTGHHLRKWQHRATHPVWPTARATCDALVYRSKRSAAPIGVAEMKSTGWQRDWDEIPAHIECQIQWQMLVADVDQAWIPALHERRFQTYHVRRSDEDTAYLLREAKTFWQCHVIADVAPAADAHWATSSALARIDRNATAVELDEHASLLARYAAARRDQAAAKKVVEGLANEIKALLGDGEIGTIAGQPVVTYPLRHRKPYAVEASSYRTLTVKTLAS